MKQNYGNVSNNVVKVDMDGVIRDMFTPMCRIYNERYGTSLTPSDITDYNVEKSFPLVMEKDRKKAANFFFIEHGAELFLNSKPYDGTIEALLMLRTFGYKVAIVTWQFTHQNKIYALKFLERNGIPYDDIFFTRDKWLVNGEWMIDDNPEFIMDERDDSRKIMVNQPYNKNSTFDGIRADGLKDAVETMLRNAAPNFP